MTEFGEKLKRAREAKGMTQQTLADKIYVTRQTISRWESGDRYPDILTLKSLSEILHISTDELLSVNEMPNVVKKSSVIEKPIIKNMSIVMYTIIVFVFSVQAATTLVSPNVIDELTSGHFYAIFTATVKLCEACLFIYCFANLIADKDTPKKAGITIALFFILELLTRLHLVINRTFSGTVTAFLSFIPFIIGSYGGYAHFIKKSRKTNSEWLIYIPSAFEIAMLLVNLSIVGRTAHSFISLTFILSVILKIAIYVTFSYQAYVIKKRRLLAHNIIQKDN